MYERILSERSSVPALYEVATTCSKSFVLLVACVFSQTQQLRLYVREHFSCPTSHDLCLIVFQEILSLSRKD